jgi:hypothetical protein
MCHPLRSIAVATFIALVLVIAIPHDTTRYVLAVAWLVQWAWFAHATYAKKPLLSEQQRRDMAWYYIDRGLALVDNEAERKLLVSWINKTN